ncbi:MAG: anti-sigma factor antagonist [Devosia sp.]|uniref:STAS domain-containing protein n=1 Tax=Devosia sp. TaxID=1871048 RepID=UPI00260935EC|nr:STAS domain-containing protein [Devosia sp.]MDB5541000.1 anti-sigma factor antagonist [Devosia sp.]
MIRVNHRSGGVLVLAVTETRLTAAVAPQFKQLVLDQIEAGNTRLVLDLSEVGFIDSTGLGAMVGILKRVGSRGDVAVCGLQPAAAQMFRLTRMDKVFRIYDDADAAVGALEQS